MDNEKIWQTVLGEMEVVLSKASFTTWFKQTSIISNDSKKVIVAVPNSFALEWLKNKYNKEIFSSLKKLVPELKEIAYKITTIKPAPEKPQKNTSPLAEDNQNNLNNTDDIKRNANNGLNPNFVFDSYVVGNSNRLAHAISVAIAKNPGTKYNPLFIYGGVGLGKTHLIHAIGNAVLAKNKNKKVIYAPCEVFGNEFIDCIQKRKMDSFKKKYRNVDVLLIDDIQFLSAKEGTQEEFFHTFNALQQTNKQIVLTSDRIPQAIPELAGRLSSRFAGGMVTDIKTPDLETRCAILKTKCQQKKLNMDKDAINYIANNIYSNIRELEGAFNKIATHCELYNEQPTINNVMKILDSIISDSKNKNLHPEKIFKVLSDFFSIKADDLLGDRRNKELVKPRQISMFLMRTEMGYSFPQIGKALGGRDHTTIMYGVKKIQREMQKNNQLQTELSLIKEKLYF